VAAPYAANSTSSAHRPSAYRSAANPPTAPTATYVIVDDDLFPSSPLAGARVDANPLDDTSPRPFPRVAVVAPADVARVVARVPVDANASRIARIAPSTRRPRIVVVADVEWRLFVTSGRAFRGARVRRAPWRRVVSDVARDARERVFDASAKETTRERDEATRERRKITHRRHRITFHPTADAFSPLARARERATAR
jgi:hypothetical protein